MSAGQRSESGPTRPRREELSPAARARLAVLIGLDFLVVSLGIRRRTVPELVEELRRPPRFRIRPLAPRRLGEIVRRVLRVGPGPPRCLVLSLVFYRLLRRQGTSAELLIGLPHEAESHEAHAWVEVDGEDVGPPPGRLGHSALARYGAGNRAPGA